MTLILIVLLVLLLGGGGGWYGYQRSGPYGGASALGVLVLVLALLYVLGFLRLH